MDESKVPGACMRLGRNQEGLEGGDVGEGSPSWLRR